MLLIPKGSNTIKVQKRKTTPLNICIKSVQHLIILNINLSFSMRTTKTSYDQRRVIRK